MKKILFLLLILVSQFSYGKLSDEDYKKVENMVFENLQKDNFLKLNRVTSGGKLTSCELEFGHVYKDFRSQSGRPVIVSGSYSLMYVREKKNVITTIKVVPTVIDVRTEKMIQTYPEYLDFQISKKFNDNKAEIRFSISDILNQRQIFYQNNNTNTDYNTSSDAIRLSRKFGTTFGITLNYSL